MMTTNRISVLSIDIDILMALNFIFKTQCVSANLIEPKEIIKAIQTTIFSLSNEYVQV